MTATVSGTFATGNNTAGLGDQQSGVLDMPSTASGNIKLTTIGLDANNSIRLQKSLDNGSSWSTITDFNSDQTGTTQAANPGTQWRLVTVAMQADHTIQYTATVES